MYVCVCGVCVRACTFRGQRLMWGVLLCCSPQYFLREGLSWELELIGQLNCWLVGSRNPPISDSSPRAEVIVVHPVFHVGAAMVSTILADCSLALSPLSQHFPWTSCAENVDSLSSFHSSSQELPISVPTQAEVERNEVTQLNERNRVF